MQRELDLSLVEKRRNHRLSPHLLYLLINHKKCMMTVRWNDAKGTV